MVSRTRTRAGGGFGVSRGIVAVYGFTERTAPPKDPLLLATAEKTANFAWTGCRGRVPWYDFDDDGVSSAPRYSAGAILARTAGLSELAPDRALRRAYRQEGERIVQSMIDRYLSPTGRLRHVQTRPRGMCLRRILLRKTAWLEANAAK